jgi:hypothetical protein
MAIRSAFWTQTSGFEGFVPDTHRRRYWWRCECGFRWEVHFKIEAFECNRCRRLQQPHPW